MRGKRYFLSWSSLFDNPDHKYDAVAFIGAVMRGGGRDVGLENCCGWSNQPKVGTWFGAPDINRIIEVELGKVFEPFRVWGAVIREQDWRDESMQSGCKEITLHIGEDVINILVNHDQRGCSRIGSSFHGTDNDCFNAAIDGIESLILAHTCAGLDVESEAYITGIQTAIEAAANQY